MNEMNLGLAVASGLLALVDKIIAVLTIRRQNAEMTPEEEAQFDALMTQRCNQAWWKASTETTSRATEANIIPPA